MSHEQERLDLDPSGSDFQCNNQDPSTEEGVDQDIDQSLLESLANVLLAMKRGDIEFTFDDIIVPPVPSFITFYPRKVV